MAIDANLLSPFLVNSQHFFYITLNNKGDFTFVNNCFLRHTAYQASSLLEKPFTGIVEQQDVDKYLHSLQACMGNGDQSFPLLLRIIDQHTSELWTCWELSPLRNAIEQQVGFQAIGYQTCERLTEQALSNDKRKILKAIFDCTTHIQFFVAPDYRILFFNKKAYDNAKLFHQKELKIGDNMLTYAKDTTNQVDERFKEEFTRALHGEVVIVETQIDYSENLSYWFQTEYDPVYEEQHVIGIAISIWDISQRKKHELYIERQNGLLAHIAHIQSHKTRQPVSTILGLLSIFNKQGLSKENKKLLALLQATAHKLDEVIHEIVANTCFVNKNEDERHIEPL